jgi:hypothetical protein
VIHFAGDGDIAVLPQAINIHPANQIQPDGSGHDLLPHNPDFVADPFECRYSAIHEPGQRIECGHPSIGGHAANA